MGLHAAFTPVNQNLSWIKLSLEGLPQHLQMLLYFNDNE